MVDKEFIRKQVLVKGMPIREAARRFGMSRKTVRKFVRDSEIPSYKRKEAPPCPVTGPWRGVVGSWLEGDEQAPKKQRHTAKRIYDRLVEEYGFAGAESTIRRLVREMKREMSPEGGYAVLAASPGEQAQADWGEAWAGLGGDKRKVHLFCMRLRKSVVPFVRAYPFERVEAFLDGHRRAFEHFGGVPEEIWYDNLTTAVRKVMEGPHRKEQVRFSSLRSHYLFESQFCNPGAGNEKGSVENLVGTVRRNTLVPLRDFSDLEKLNRHLESWCLREREKRREAFEEERQALRPLPAVPFRSEWTSLHVVTKSNLVHFDRNAYSVPPGWSRQAVEVTASVEMVRIASRGILLAEHRRLDGSGLWSMPLEHLLPLLEKKPRAARNALAVRELPQPWQVLRRRLCREPEGYRELSRILLLSRETPLERVTQAVEEALHAGRPTLETVRQMLLNRRESPERGGIEVPGHLSAYRVEAPDLSRFDLLVGVR